MNSGYGRLISWFGGRGVSAYPLALLKTEGSVCDVIVKLQSDP